MSRMTNSTNQALKPTTRVVTIPGNKLIPREKLPSQQQVLDVLVSLTETNNGRNPIPEALPNLPPFLPKYLQDTELTDMMSVNLQFDDMDPAKAMRQQNLQRLLQACQIRQYKALGLPPPALYRSFAIMSKYDPRNPEASKGNMIVTTPNVDTFKIITRSLENNTVIMDKASNVGIPIIPALDHANDCYCQALYMHNNYESLQPVLMCIPKELAKSYSECPRWPNCYEMGYSAPVHRNFSDIFYSEVSIAGTVLPQLVRRQPVTQLNREKPVLKKPQYAEMNLKECEPAVAAILAQLDRGEIRQFTKFLNMGPIPIGGYDISRFRSFNRHMLNNIDISSYGMDIRSMEDILINEPLVDTFFGRQCCEYCLTQLDVKDETTYFTHLSEEHPYLLDSYFTCPACLIPSVFSAQNYNAHYEQHHAGAVTLMNVLNETNVHVRTQHAHLLNLFILAAKLMKYTPDVHETGEYVSSIGGYSMKEPGHLGLRVLELQHSMVPATLNYPEDRFTASPRGRSRSPSPTWTTVLKKKERTQPTFENREIARPTPDYLRGPQLYVNMRNNTAAAHSIPHVPEKPASQPEEVRPRPMPIPYKTASMMQYPQLQEDRKSKNRILTLPKEQLTLASLIDKQNSRRQPRSASPPDNSSQRPPLN